MDFDTFKKIVGLIREEQEELKKYDKNDLSIEDRRNNLYHAMQEAIRCYEYHTGEKLGDH